MVNRVQAAAAVRPFTASALRLNEAAVDKNASKTFEEQWSATNPGYLAVPKFGKDYLAETRPDPVPGEPLPAKLTFNLFMPHQVEMEAAEVEMVLVPGSDGDFGILPGHVPTVAQLRPGVMSVHNNNDADVTKYFVSSGFAFVHANSTADVCAVECIPLDQLDASVVTKNLADFTATLASATDEVAKAEAQIGVDVCSAMQSALSA